MGSHGPGGRWEILRYGTFSDFWGHCWGAEGLVYKQHDKPALELARGWCQCERVFDCLSQGVHGLTTILRRAQAKRGWGFCATVRWPFDGAQDERTGALGGGRRALHGLGVGAGVRFLWCGIAIFGNPWSVGGRVEGRDG